jgi:hypothetical protein
VVLTGNVALAACQVKGRNVVSAVSVLELDGSSTGCKSKQLVTETDTHDWNLGRLHQSAQVIDGFLAVSWVTRAVGDEDTVEVVGNLVDWKVVWEDSDACTAANHASQDVLLNAAIDDRNVHISVLGADVERSFGADFLDQVDLLGIDESLILIGVILLSNGDSGQ